MDTDGLGPLPLLTDEGPVEGVVVDQAGPPGVPLHLGPHQIPRGEVTKTVAKKRNKKFGRYLIRLNYIQLNHQLFSVMPP